MAKGPAERYPSTYALLEVLSGPDSTHWAPLPPGLPFTEPQPA